MAQTPPSSPFPGAGPPWGTGSAGSGVGGSGSGGSPSASSTPSGFIGRYQMLEKIGEGGMGSLYLARDPAIDRLVAIKLLRRGFDTEAVRERFAREARAAGRLRHSNIVTIFDVGEHDGDPFIAMEFLAGETLGELIRHNAGLSLARRLKLLEELCDGLAYAHRAGLVHRDIKPANLMVDAEGVLKILDFGIVRVGDSGMTQAGVLVGTINYMSPEQVLGTGIDHRSDIFAVGLVAYELLSGRQAFVGTMKDGLLRRIPNAEIEPLSAVAPGLDPEVIAIVEHALQKDPADRYQELARMRNDFARVRQRIEVEEERAAVLAASASAETALIAEEMTAPGTPIEMPRPDPPGPLAAAERALAEGNYRFALTMAGRAAALDPQDRSPGTIVARAEQALLERGRTFASPPPTPRSGAGMATPVSAPSAVPPASGTAPPVASTASYQRANYLAIGVAIVALFVAGFAVWSQVRRPDSRNGGAPDGSNQASVARGGEDIPSQPTATPPVSTSPSQQENAAATPESNPSSRDSGGTPAEGRETAQPANRSEPAPPRQREADRRAKERSSTQTGSRATTPPAGAQARREESRPEQATPARRQELSPQTSAPISGLPETAKAPSTLPGAPGPAPVSPPLPPPPPPKPAANPATSKTEPAPRPEPPRRDPRAEAQTAIESLLGRYEAAWEALDFNALRRVWVMPDPRGVESTMGRMREYAMDLSGCLGQSIRVAADARSATAACRVSYDFEPAVGSRTRQAVDQTFTFEKRDDTWLITGIQ